VAPLLRGGISLHVHRGFRYAVFPAAAGAGRNWGSTTIENGWADSWAASMRSAVRPLSGADAPVPGDLGRKARDFVLEGDWMPDYLATKYAISR